MQEVFFAYLFFAVVFPVVLKVASEESFLPAFINSKIAILYKERLGRQLIVQSTFVEVVSDVSSTVAESYKVEVNQVHVAPVLEAIQKVKLLNVIVGEHHREALS